MKSRMRFASAKQRRMRRKILYQRFTWGFCREQTELKQMYERTEG